ncbi:uncharacterized protein [Triticum aestivum]|uniref:uncharacterized protein n=1 Tax=Triticum aestivum TaxID=4565 RepID=UPI001D01E6BA|nr:uncharacterized protein LOC123043087 [Triticum aestivum]
MDLAFSVGAFLLCSPALDAIDLLQSSSRISSNKEERASNFFHGSKAGRQHTMNSVRGALGCWANLADSDAATEELGAFGEGQVSGSVPPNSGGSMTGVRHVMRTTRRSCSLRPRSSGLPTTNFEKFNFSPHSRRIN